MKTQILLDIKKPCSENWESFTPTPEGGFCSSCSKTVIDFTKMNDEQILNYFSNQSARTCGRFRADQLKHYSYAEPVYIKPGFSLLKAGLLSLFVLLVGRPSTVAQNPERPKFEIVQPAIPQETVASIDREYLIKGVVKSKDDGFPMPGVSIYAKGSTDGIATDAEGKFVFPRKLKVGEVLIFSFIGYDTKEYVVKKDENVITELMVLNMEMNNCIMLGEVAVDHVYFFPAESPVSGTLRVSYHFSNHLAQSPEAETLRRSETGN